MERGPGVPAKIFLSYGRRDDEPFVRWLHERLGDEGFEVWWDRERMPSRGLTFLKEIRDAIRETDRVLVVLGPHCAASDYCRAEWQAALAEAKPVSPVLRLGTRELVPPELAHLHCPDARDDARRSEILAEIVRVLREPVPALGPLLGAVPDLPPHFQPRPEALSRLAGAVLVDDNAPRVLTGPERVCVLHGMGGAGKSVLAASFARSTTTRRSFQDGVCWVDASAQAPLAIAASLGRLLELPAPSVLELAACTSELARALAQRRTLIVVDNAWRMEQIEWAIAALGPSCRLLVTTRHATLATGSGAASLEVRELSPDEAQQHLADWAGVAPPDLPVEAAEVAAECGYLPFALALNGAMHQQGVGWPDLRDALRAAEIDYAEQRFQGYPYPTVLRSIKVSMDALDAEDAAAGERLRELAAFRTAAVSEAAVGVLWGHAGLAARHVRKLLGQLAGRALIRLDGPADARRVVVHDLQRDYLARVTDGAALNRRLVAAYEASCGGDWPRLAPDGYIHHHVVEHLLAADRAAEVTRLLDGSTADGRNAWFEARDALDEVAGYLADLERAAQHAPDEAAALHLRVMQHSVAGMLARLPAELHVALLRSGRVRADAALAATRLIADPERRVSELLALLPELDARHRRDALADCLDTVRKRGVQVRARLLPQIARGFEGAERAALAAEGVAAARSVYVPEYRAHALALAVDAVDEAQRDEVIDEAADALRAAVTSNSLRDDLALLAPHRPELVGALLEHARAIEDDFGAAMAFDAIVPYLPAAQRADAAHEGIARFEASRANGLWIVIGLARHIPDFDVDDLIRRAATADPRQAPHLIASLPELLGGDALASALQHIAGAARGFPEPTRTMTRIALLARRDANREDETAALLRDIPRLPYDSWRRKAYLAILDDVPRERLLEIRRHMVRLDDAPQVLAAAAQLAAHAGEDLRHRLVARIRELPASRDKLVALIALATSDADPHRAAELGEAALAAAFEAVDSSSEPLGLRILRLEPLVPAAAFAKLLEREAHAILRTGASGGAREFIALSPHLPAALREAGFRALLRDSERLSHDSQEYFVSGRRQLSDNTPAVAELLQRIAAELPDAVLPEAIAAARRIAVERWRCLALCHLLPRLDGDARRPVLDEALARITAGALDVHETDDASVAPAVVRGLAALAPLVDGAARGMAEQRLHGLLAAIDDAWLSGLLPALSKALGAADLEALAERAAARTDDWSRLAASRVLSPPRRWTLRLAALADTALREPLDAVTVGAFDDAVAALVDAPPEVRLQAWDQALAQLQGTRRIAAVALAHLAPLAASIGREAVLAAAARGLVAVASWWP